VKRSETRTWSTEKKLLAVLDIVSAVADMHDVDRNGIPSIIHDDIETSQFVRVSSNSM
jgi:hypothetical protein